VLTCRLRVECERLDSKLSRQKPFIKELEKESSAARSVSRQAAEQAGLLERELRQLRQQHQEEQAALTAELNKARHAAR
jgi:membrane protein involved in colicin uptake